MSSIGFGLALLLSLSHSLRAATEIPDELKGVGVKEHLGEYVSINDLKFKNEQGHSVLLGDYFVKQNKPVLLNLVYFECPMLCTLVLDGMVKGLKTLDWVPGREFDVVTVSIDPTEGPELAAKKKKAYLEAYGRPEAARGWHFLTGTEDQIRKLADQVGFEYKWVEKEQQYAHAAVIFALAPDGKITRYLYGAQYSKKDLKLSLLEASNGEVGTVVDRILLFCFQYDPQLRKYSLYLTRLMKAGCGGTLVIFGAYLAVFWRRQRKGA